MLKKIKEEAFQLQEEIIRIRREFHQIPEVGLSTQKTADHIANYLEERGVSWKKNIGGPDCHSVVANITGKHPGKCTGRGDGKCKLHKHDYAKSIY